MKRLILLAVIALCLALSAESLHLNEKIKRSATQKLYFRERPYKEKGLLEKPEEQGLESQEEEEEESSESDWPFDFEEIFSQTREKLPDLDELQETFSQVWGNVFGNSDEESGEEESPVNRTSSSFLSQILSFAKPWWQGENVCSREENFEEDASGESESEFSSLSTTCQDTGNAYKCTMSVGKEGKRKVRTLIYECCHGFGREAGKQGCPRSLELKDLSATLEEMNLTRFIETAESLGINAKLESENFTIFVPTNEAMTTITDSDEINFVVSQTKDKMQFVRDILLGHMVKGWEPSHTWEDEKVLETEQEGASVRINFYTHPRPFATANCARVTSLDRKTTGGLIHTVDRVLIPARQTIWDMLGEDTRFSIFTSLVKPTLQEKLMDNSSHHTVLAFTDAAFQKLPEDVKTKLRNETEDGCMQNLLSELVFPHTICTAAVQGNVLVRNILGRLVNGSRWTEEGEEDIVSFGGIPVTLGDRMATNGVIHVMGGVFLPDHVLDLVTVAERNGGEVFSELLKTTKDLSKTVRPLTSATLFVPPNQALLDLPDEVQSDDSKREELLKNHIVNNRVEVSLRNPETLIETEAGRELSLVTKPTPFGFSLRSFAQRMGSAHLHCARIIKSNVRACGGLVHFVDRVLSIPSKSMLEVLSSREELSEFVTLLEMSEVSKELNSEFSGTVLAPTNDALNTHLSTEAKTKLLENKKAFQTFVKRHILNDSVCCHSLGSGFWFQPQRHSTLGGGRLRSVIRGTKRVIGGAQVENCDIHTTNGLVHVVDKPIFQRRTRGSILGLFNRRNGRGRGRQTSIFDWPF